jgi:hypothetical protein
MGIGVGVCLDDFLHTAWSGRTSPAGASGFGAFGVMRKSGRAESAVAPARGGITVFQGSTSHQPPRQVNGGVRRLYATLYDTFDGGMP